MKNFNKPTSEKLKLEYATKLSEILRINKLDQTELADILGTISQNVNKWLNIRHLPGPEFRTQIDALYTKSFKEENLRSGNNEKINQG